MKINRDSEGNIYLENIHENDPSFDDLTEWAKNTLNGFYWSEFYGRSLRGTKMEDIADVGRITCCDQDDELIVKLTWM